MLMRLLPRDENGTPRPLRGHGEALRWSATTVASPLLSWRAAGSLVVVLVGGALGRYLRSGDPPDPTSFLIAMAGLAVIGVFLWLCGTVLLYVYAVLLGGVEGRASRGR